MKILDLVLSVIGQHWECDRAPLGVESREWHELIAFSKGGSFGFWVGIDCLRTRREARRWVRRCLPLSRWAKTVVRTRVIWVEEARRDRLERDSKGSVGRICMWVGCGWERRKGVKKASLQSDQCCPSLRGTFVYLLATRNPYSVFFSS